jgi:hypothetical protein
MNQSDKQAIVFYLRAVRNEIALDEFAYKRRGVDPKRAPFLPKPDKIPTSLIANRTLSRVVCWAAKFAWLSLGYFLFSTIKFVRLFQLTCRQLLFTSRIALIDESALIQVSDLPLTKNFDLVSFKGPATIIVAPWIRRTVTQRQKNCIRLTSIARPEDALRALRLCFAVYPQFVFDRHLRAWNLQSYTAYSWFFIWSILERQETKLVTLEHFDRWAVLFDGISRLRLLRCSKATKSGTVIIQHGLISSLDNDNLLLPYRMRYATKLYCFDRIEERAFRSHILSNSSINQALSVSYYSPSIQLSELAPFRNDRPRVLFVGHPSCLSFHRHLYEQLVKGRSILAFYKPHPRCQCPLEAQASNWTIINQETLFPVVDFVISYPSTLELEYRQQGVPSQIHSLSPDTSDFAPILAKISDRLESLNKTH